SRASDSTLSLIARQFGVLGISALRAGMQELDVNCAMPKSLVSCALRRPAIAIDAVFRERRLAAEIEQALVKPPLRVLRRHMGHGADFRRHPEIHAPFPNDDETRGRDHRHAGAE